MAGGWVCWVVAVGLRKSSFSGDVLQYEEETDSPAYFISFSRKFIHGSTMGKALAENAQQS